jgi:nitrogen fixation/metabolism regulation signal transduction histidine kinase
VGIAYLAAAINGMLAELDGSRRRTASFLEAVPDLILLVNPDDTVRDMRVPDGLMPQPPEDARGRPLAAVVADLGVMDVEVRDRLFTPHVTTKPYGSGMGLYLAHRLATGRYQGHLELVARPGGGTIARLELEGRQGEGGG